MEIAKFAPMNTLLSLKQGLGRLLAILVFPSLILAWQGCSTELDVTADWEDITVVYGLIDAGDSLHFVKVDKAFLGEGDALVLAQVRDSSEYDNIGITLDQLDENRNLVRTWTLRDTTLEQEAGSSFAPRQTVYYFKATDLKTDSTNYRLNISIDEDLPTAKTVSAETPLLGDIFVTFPAQTFPVALANRVEYREQRIRWLSLPNAVNYDLSMIIPIEETADGGNTITTRELVWQLGALETEDADGGRELEFEIQGEEFYRFIEGQLDHVPGLQRKVPDGEVTLVIWAGGEELSTYIQVANPSSSLIQDRPEYTNVENGFGIFSTRTRQTFVRVVDKDSWDEMISGLVGGLTADLGFCHPTDPLHADWCEF